MTPIINHLSDELELAEKKKVRPRRLPLCPRLHLHGDVAVAYGISSERVIGGKPHRSYYANYYVWKNSKPEQAN
jgi:hypothetical protein